MPVALVLPEVTPELVPPDGVLPVHGLGEALLTLGTVVIEVTPSDWTVICEVKLGDGTVIIGLTPPLSISVAPSGMDPPESNDPDVAPGVKRGDTLPVDDTVAAGAALQPLENIPPPSKVVPAAAPD
jgi:hypothetical protein